MRSTDLQKILKDKRVVNEINKHLWIESQKAGYSVGIERATDEWVQLYAPDWLKYNEPVQYQKIYGSRKDSTNKNL